jgi:hypothetical protein
MLVIVGVVALGGAADPGASLQLEPLGPLTWPILHLLAALAALALLSYTSFLQWLNIQANHEVIEQIMAEVRRVRTERGLDVET